jgi:monoamine oxidase
MHTRVFDADVLVLGGGMAGLTATHALQQEGRHALLLEASDRLGGRIEDRIQYVGRQPLPIALGAEFIHTDPGENPAWLRLRQHFSLRYEAIGSAGMTVLGNEMLHDARERPPKSSGMLQVLRAEIERYFASGGKDMQMKKYLLEHGGSALPDRDHQELLNGILANEYGLDIHRLPIAALREPDSYSSINVRPRLGFGNLVGQMSEVIHDIRLNTAVRLVEWSKGNITMHMENGGTLAAPRAVIAVPDEILRSNHVKFDPALPLKKRKTLSRLTSTNVVKVLMEFREKFWRSGAEFIRGGSFQLAWAPLHLHNEDALHLTALIGGTRATTLGLLKSGNAAKRVAMEIMKMHDIHNAKDLFVNGQCIAWHKRPWIQTGYSALRVHAPHDVREQARASVEDTLYFAGEYTSTENPASVTGALETGFMAADEILGREGRNRR